MDNFSTRQIFSLDTKLIFVDFCQSLSFGLPNSFVLLSSLSSGFYFILFLFLYKGVCVLLRRSGPDSVPDPLFLSFAPSLIYSWTHFWSFAFSVARLQWRLRTLRGGRASVQTTQSGTGGVVWLFGREKSIRVDILRHFTRYNHPVDGTGTEPNLPLCWTSYSFFQ